MIARNSIEWLRGLDKRWQRTRNSEKRRILIDSRTAMNFATVAPIVEGLQCDPRIDIYLTASEGPDKIPQIYASASPNHQPIGPTAAAFVHFDAYLTADFLWTKLPRGARRVQTFHGVAGKFRTVYDSPSKSMRGWDRLFFINSLRLQNFIETGAIDASSPAIRLIGMPRLDCLVDGSLQRNKILESLDIDPERKTVLYAPTWSKYSSVASMGEDIVKRLGSAGYTVIVKLHDRSRQGDDYHSGGADWGQRLLPVLKSVGGVLATGANSSPYLAAADILITDHSSVGFEYLLLDRPLVRIHIPELLERTDIEPIYVRLLTEASISVSNIEQLEMAVEKSLTAPTENARFRKEVADKMFYKPGGATARAIAEMYDVIELTPDETALNAKLSLA
jgi:hypothetical protein